MEVHRAAGAWLAGASIPSGLMWQQLREAHLHGAPQSRRERPPGEPGKSGPGLMAQYKAVFWRAAYRVHDYWHVMPAHN